MNDVKINISSTGFPSQFVSDAEKATDEFGLQIGQAIQYEWFKKDGRQCRFYSQWGDFHRLRLYARGEQSVGKYKNELAVDGDLSYLNLDWTPVPILPKFVDIVVNGMSDRLFKVKAYSQDALSQSKRSKFQEMIEGQMIAKPFLQKIQENTGVNPFTVDSEELPETDEELALYMQLKYKPAIEIAEETAIDTMFDENHYQDIRKRIDYDLTVLGMGVAKTEFLPGAGVKVEYVDPANIVYSYTEDPNFKDCFYWGEIKTVPIIELKKIDQTLTNADLEEISKYGQSWYDYYNVAQYYDNDIFYRDTTTLMYFNYKTTKKVVYKKKIKDSGAISMVEKDDQFNPPKEMMDEGSFEKVEKTIDVWYNGVMVMGTNIILKWEMAENMVRPKSATQHALPNYVATAPRMYKGVIESLVRRMIPFADLIQITHLKLQQVIAKVVPDGVFIDADGLNEVDLGTGAAYNPEDALRLYFQTGSVIGRSYTGDGEFNNARVPIQQLTSNSGASKTQMLIGNYNHYLNQIRNVTGLNEARDGSLPDRDTLVGLQKIAAQQSNIATKHINNASLYLTLRLCENISKKLADVVSFPLTANALKNSISTFNVQTLAEISNLNLHDFGIFLDLEPDEEEKAQLEQNIQVALQSGGIDLEDAIDLRQIRNLKLANQMLKQKRRLKQERDQKAAQANMQAQAQANGQLAEQTAMAETQKQQILTDQKMQLEQAKSQFEIQRMQAEAAIKRELMAEEFNYNVQLAKERFNGEKGKEESIEDRKDKRARIIGTQQSQMIQQRQNDGTPIDFESTNDNLGDFGLEAFGPK